MRKDSAFLGLFLLLIVITSAAQNQVISKTPIYTINSNEIIRNVRDWPTISLLRPDQYHTPEELIEELQQINKTAPQIIDFFSIGKSFQGRDIFCLRITNEQNTLPKAGVLLVAQHHAREQITVEAVLRFMLQLVNNYGIDEDITEYIDNEEIFVIPSLNPDGLHYVVGNDTLKGDPWLRKNLRSIDDDGDGVFEEDPPEDTNGDGIISEFDIYVKDDNDEWINSGYYYFEGFDNDGDGKVNEDPIGGVDLNRNYAYRWNDPLCNSGWTTDTTQEDYPGTTPFSEPETQVYRDFVNDKSFASAISFHSGINATYFPWSADPYWVEKDLYYKISSDLQSLLPPKYFGYLGNLERNAYAETYYTCAGEWGDWMYAMKNCLVPMTFEIYHNASSSQMVELMSENNSHQIWRWDGIYEMFAPVESAIDALWEDIQPAFDYWLENTPRLEITAESVRWGDNKNDTLKVKLTIKNLSPVIRTIDDLNVLDQNFNSVLKDGSPITIPEIAARRTKDASFEFELIQDLGAGENITLVIGNDFVGYYSIIFQENQIKEAQNASLEILIPLFAVSITALVKSRKKI